MTTKRKRRVPVFKTTRQMFVADGFRDFGNTPLSEKLYTIRQSDLPKLAEQLARDMAKDRFTRVEKEGKVIMAIGEEERYSQILLPSVRYALRKAGLPGGKAKR